MTECQYRMMSIDTSNNLPFPENKSLNDFPSVLLHMIVSSAYSFILTLFPPFCISPFPVCFVFFSFSFALLLIDCVI